MTDKNFFTSRLLSWNKNDNRREMPWKGEKDPYKIWLSEIILQQTRVEQGWDYYNRFVTAFPTVQQLAKAPETKVFKLWEGLGYYTRCKNLIATARIIVNEYKGKFPLHYEDILALKGVGPYTAAAIASFAFNEPYAVVDGNVFRVLSRYFAIGTPIDSTAGKKLFTALAGELLDLKQPGLYNQALMDFGATICKPQSPLCTGCALKSKCAAYLKGMTGQLPVKEKTIVNRNRWFCYFVITYNGKVYLHKRPAKDIWENLYEFVLVERSAALPRTKQGAATLLKELLGSPSFTVTAVSQPYRQQLTHQTIEGRFIKVGLTAPLKIPGFTAFSAAQAVRLPFPRFITQYLAETGGF